MVAAEAMARGCTLVAGSTGFAADLTRERDAVILDEISPTIWQESLIALLGDAGRRQRMGAAGRRRVQALRWAPSVDRLETSYANLLHGMAAGRA